MQAGSDTFLFLITFYPPLKIVLATITIENNFFPIQACRQLSRPADKSAFDPKNSIMGS